MIVLFSLFLILGATQNSNAQVVDDPVLKACEEVADRAKRLETENISLKAQLDLEKQKVANANEATANAKEQAEFWKKASQTGDKIDNASALTIQYLREQVADDRLEIERLRDENKDLRNSRNWRTALGFGAGFATGYFTKKN